MRYAHILALVLIFVTSCASQAAPQPHIQAAPDGVVVIQRLAEVGPAKLAVLTRDEIVAALIRLGEIALAEGYTLHLVVVGGAAMVLAYNARLSTHDIDALFVPPPDARTVRAWAKQLAHEFGWGEDWLNDAAKGYLMGLSYGPVLLTAPGIEVRQPAVEQLLAMKLCAWRDDVDIADATRLLAELLPTGNRDHIWQRVVPYLLPGRELKAQYAFADLWEASNGDD